VKGKTWDDKAGLITRAERDKDDEKKTPQKEENVVNSHAGLPEGRGFQREGRNPKRWSQKVRNSNEGCGLQ